MQCEICLRFASSRLPFNCTLCARDSLYQPRIQFAQLLLQKEAVEKEVGLTVADSTKSNRVTLSPGAKSSNLSPTYTVQRAVAEQVVSEESTQTVLVHVESLREETKNIRMEISARKARLLRRRTDLASAKQELAQSQTSAVQPVERGIKRTEHRWDLMHKKTTESRIFLSREAALLYGLHQRKRTKGGLGRDVYFIGGVPIADLRDLNSMLWLSFRALRNMLKMPQMLLQPKYQLQTPTSRTSSTWSPTIFPSVSRPKLSSPIATIPSPQYSRRTHLTPVAKCLSLARRRPTLLLTAPPPPGTQISAHCLALDPCILTRNYQSSSKTTKSPTHPSSKASHSWHGT